MSIKNNRKAGLGLKSLLTEETTTVQEVSGTSVSATGSKSKDKQSKSLDSIAQSMIKSHRKKVKKNE